LNTELETILYLWETIMTVLLAMFLARILLLFSRAMYMVETAATVPLATSPTVNITEVATPTY
jgi:hypothetical protein